MDDLQELNTISLAESPQLRNVREIVEESQVPLIGFGNRSVMLYSTNGLPTWALLNLILSLLGVMYAAAAFLYAILRKKRDEQEIEENQEYAEHQEIEEHQLHEGYKQYAKNREDEEYQDYKQNHNKELRIVCLLIAILLSIVGIVMFILTQNMRYIMVLIDWWTLVHLIVFVLEIVAIAFMYKRKKDDGFDGEAEYVEPPPASAQTQSRLSTAIPAGAEG